MCFKMWSALALVVATCLGCVSGQGRTEDALAKCRQHYQSDPKVLDNMHFFNGNNGEDFAQWKTMSLEEQRPLINTLRFHFISVLEEQPRHIVLCVGLFDTTTYTMDKDDQAKYNGWVTFHTRPALPAGIVKLSTTCWRDRKKFASCDPEFKPMEFVRNLPQYNYSPLEEHFWDNMTTQGLEVDSNWIWRINTQSSEGSIKAEWLWNLQIDSLEELEVYGNDWGRPDHLLKPLPGLKDLDLSYNNLEVLPEDILSNSPKLEKINLGHNNISKFPTEVKYLEQLWLLDLTNPLGNASLKITDEDIDNFPKTLQTVGLENTKLTTNVTKFIIDSNLFFLNLSGCALKNINDSEDRNRTSLKMLTLDLSSNELENLPLNLLNRMHILIRLRLHRNKLKVWPQQILEQNKLEKLDLSANLITNLTELSFRNFKNLKILDLSRNKIEYLSRHIFRNLTNLKHVYLYSNVISFIAPDLIQYSPSIDEINLSDNRIATLPHFCHKNSEMVINLSHNFIQTFNGSCLEIKEVDLSFNVIESMIIREMKKMNISHNHLRYISPHMWGNISLLEEVDLGGQSFECCLFENATYFKEAVETKVKLLGTDEGMTCSINRTSPKILLRTFVYNETECHPRKLEEVIRPIGVEIILPLSLLVVAVAGIALMMFIYRFELTYVSHLFGMKKDGTDSDEQRYKTCVYDAFVCYSARNFDWVAGTLVPGLEEGGAGYRLCLHDRDFALGAGINSNIVASLEKSRKVIFALSKDFIASKWCQWELEMANHKMWEERRNYIILVELERLERRSLPRHLRYLMDRTTYLEWPVQVQTGTGQAQNGSAQTQNGSAHAHNGSSQTHNGSAQTQNGSAHAHNGSAQTQNGSAQTQNGSAHAHNGSTQTQKRGRANGLSHAQALQQRRLDACFRRLRSALGESLKQRTGRDPKPIFTVLHA